MPTTTTTDIIDSRIPLPSPPVGDHGDRVDHPDHCDDVVAAFRSTTRRRRLPLFERLLPRNDTGEMSW